MSTQKVADLIGSELDVAVAMAEGLTDVFASAIHDCGWSSRDEASYAPSTDWSQGGPIIEREQITISPYERLTGHRSPALLKWVAGVFDGREPTGHHMTLGPTPLVAAMRALVALKAGGETVELP